MKQFSSCIAQSRISALQAPLTVPFRTALGEHKTLDNWLLTIELEDKTLGFGEAAVAAHITGETLRETYNQLKKAADLIMGENINDYLKISGLLHKYFYKNTSVIAAVEMAILDALTKKKGIPLWKMFGKTPVTLKSNITIVIDSVEKTEECVKRFYAKGFRAFKVKVGRNLDEDIKRVMVVKRFAPRSQIYIDANQGFTAAATLKFLKTLSLCKIKPDLIEQPVPRSDLEGLARVTHSTDIPVFADESARSKEEVLTLIKKRAVKGINIKIMKFGVIVAADIAKLAYRSGMKLMISAMMESALSITASAHLAAGLKIFDYVDLDTPFFVKNELKRMAFLAPNGVYNLKKIKKGIGISPI